MQLKIIKNGFVCYFLVVSKIGCGHVVTCLI